MGGGGVEVGVGSEREQGTGKRSRRTGDDAGL